MGPIQNAVLAPQANYLHIPFFVHPLGLDSQVLPGGVEIHMDFCAGNVFILRGPDRYSTLAFADHTQYSLFEAMLADLRHDVLAEFFAGADDTGLPETMMKRLHEDKNRVEFLKIEDVAHHEPLTVNHEISRNYVDLLNMVSTAYARFRARLKGHLTPIVVWPEHFDLSPLWFAEGDFDDSKAQMNFGFAPFSDGLPYPYLYVTGYPYKDELQVPALPEGANWHSQGWMGIVVPYSELAKQENLEAYIEKTMRTVFPIMSSLIKLPANP
jgi:hypothetical protein